MTENNQVLELNVSGEIFYVFRSTLTCIPSCSLSKMFASNSKLQPASKDPNGRYFLPYNPLVFRFIFDYLYQFDQLKRVTLNETLLKNLYAAPFQELKNHLEYFGLEEAIEFIYSHDPLYSSWYSNNSKRLIFFPNNTALKHDQSGNLIRVKYTRMANGIELEDSEGTFDWILFDDCPGHLSKYWIRHKWIPTSTPPQQLRYAHSSYGPDHDNVEMISPGFLRVFVGQGFAIYFSFDNEVYDLVETENISDDFAVEHTLLNLTRL
eukprot:gb/GECH01002588.1/.p1 GENE.gb/GECH01002588.1/~~gb/GECH01002588.1/.p1  ORF type:complete len:265 (+),score=56.78 gb/GECH01002588.1/:1-795(+)